MITTCQAVVKSEYCSLSEVDIDMNRLTWISFIVSIRSIPEGY